MTSVLPELNQTPSMYNHGPSYNIRPVELSDPYGTKFTAKTVNYTAQIRGKRGFGSILAKAIPGLITLAVESVSSYIKGKQQLQRIVSLTTTITQLFHQSFLMEEGMCYWQIFMDLGH